MQNNPEQNNSINEAEIMRIARKRAWQATRGYLYIALSGIAGTIVAIILAVILYG